MPFTPQRYCQEITEAAALGSGALTVVWLLYQLLNMLSNGCFPLHREEGRRNRRGSEGTSDLGSGWCPRAC